MLAARRVSDVRDGDHSVRAGIDLMRAHTLEAYREALDHWVTPPVSAVYAGVDQDDGESHIAFHSLLGIPERVPATRDGQDVTGRHPYDGSDSSQDWQGVLGLDWHPHVIDPPSGFVFSGNHLPAGSWYDAFVYSGIGGNGDTYRSFEIRRRLTRLLADGPVEPSALHALHVDAGSETMQLVGYYDAANPQLLMRRLRRLFSRARPLRSEIQILRGVLSATARSLARRDLDD